MPDMFLSWLFLSQIPKKETGASDQDGEAKRKKTIPIAKETLSNYILKETAF